MAEPLAFWRDGRLAPWRTASLRVAVALTEDRAMGADSWRVRANMTQGGRAVGGHLSVAERRIAFTPHGVDRATGGQRFDHGLDEIGSVDIAPRTFHPFDGGLSKRLRLTMRDGSEALFVVRGAANLRDQIMRSVETDGDSS